MESKPAHCRTFSTAVGEMGIVFDQYELMQVFLPEDSPTKLRQKIHACFGSIPKSDDAQQEVVEDLQRYFAGEKIDFNVSIDWSGYSNFKIAVWKACQKIPYGQTVSYGELAAAADQPGAARAVGSAMAKNPFPIIVPCHRVIRSDGSLGEYSGSGGVAFKQTLQDLESAGLLKT